MHLLEGFTSAFPVVTECHDEDFQFSTSLQRVGDVWCVLQSQSLGGAKCWVGLLESLSKRGTGEISIVHVEIEIKFG
jgi:hypothetical protein